MSDIQKYQPKESALSRITSVRDWGQKILDGIMSGMAPTTRRTYSLYLKDFAHFLELNTPEEASALFVECSHPEASMIAMAYKENMMQRGLSPSSVNGRLCALRKIAQIARAFGKINWTVEIPSLRNDGIRDTSGPGVHVLRRMMDAAKNQGGRMALRDVAILRIMFDLALRVEEVVSIDIEDLDLDSDRPRVQIMRKRRKQKKWLSLPQKTVEAIQAWLEDLPRDSGALFVNFDRCPKGDREEGRNNRRLTQRGAHHVIKKLGRMAGKKVWPHGIRHTSITEAMKSAHANNTPIEEVRSFSDHTSINTLLRYRDDLRNVQGELASLVSEGV